MIEHPICVECGEEIEKGGNRYWCKVCDRLRRDRIMKSLEDIQQSFNTKEEQ